MNGDAWMFNVGRSGRAVAVAALCLFTLPAVAQVGNLPERQAAHSNAVAAIAGAIAAGDYAGYTNRLETLRATTIALDASAAWLASRCRAALGLAPFANRQEAVDEALVSANDSHMERDQALFDAVLLEINHYTNHEALAALTLNHLTNAVAVTASALTALQAEHARLAGTALPAFLVLMFGGPGEATPGERVELIASVANVGDTEATNLQYRLENAMHTFEPPPTPGALGNLPAGATREFSVFVRMPDALDRAAYSLSVWADGVMSASVLHDLSLGATTP